jgi:hypothetical protein
VGVEEVLLQLQDLASHHCLLEYPGQTQQTMIMVQFQAILHIEQAFQVIQALTVTVVDMGVIQDFLVAMVLVMEAMVTAMVDMGVTTLMEGEVMEGQVIIGKILKIKIIILSTIQQFNYFVSNKVYFHGRREFSTCISELGINCPCIWLH